MEAPPEDWQQGPASPGRKVSYVVRGEGGTVADISLMILPGQAGGLLSNVNSWRAQLGLRPLDRMAFEKQSEWITTGVGEAVVVDLRGLAEGAEPAFDGRSVTAVIEKPDQTLFFKIRGNASLVEAQREAFLDWVAACEGDAPDSSSPMKREAPTDWSEPPGGHKRAWEVPEHWVVTPAKPGAIASFAVTEAGGRSGVVSALFRAGDPEGMLAAVNRWRREAGLAAIDAVDFATFVDSFWVGDRSFSLARMAGPGGSSLAAWIQREEGTWVFLLRGPAVVVNAERPHFARFLRSVEFDG